MTLMVGVTSYKSGYLDNAARGRYLKILLITYFPKENIFDEFGDFLPQNVDSFSKDFLWIDKEFPTNICPSQRSLKMTVSDIFDSLRG